MWVLSREKLALSFEKLSDKVCWWLTNASVIRQDSYEIINDSAQPSASVQKGVS